MDNKFNSCFGRGTQWEPVNLPGDNVEFGPKFDPKSECGRNGDKETLGPKIKTAHCPITVLKIENCNTPF